LYASRRIGRLRPIHPNEVGLKGAGAGNGNGDGGRRWSRIGEAASLAGCLPLIVADKHAELAANAIYLKLPVNFGCC